jgi:hypothetical protein
MLPRSHRPLSRLAILACAVALGFGAASAEERPHVPGVDWERKVIRASGSGAPDLRAPNIAVARLGAERAARMDAMRNILETLQGVQVTSGSTAGGIMDADSAVKARVEGVLRNFQVVDTRYYSDGGVEVDVEMSIVGDVARALMPPGPPEPLQSEGEARYSGLVIDASGSGLTPALAPRILDERGNEVFGARNVNAEAVASRGVAGYRRSMDEARADERAGDAPLILRALEAKGADVIITNADAATIKNEAQNLSFLSDGRVVIVID